MPAGNDFIFCLQDASFNFWRIDSNGTVSKSSDPYFMDFAPAGWDDIAIKNVRNKRYWGIDRSVTIPLAYVMDGGNILKHIFYTLGIEEPVYLVICSQKLFYEPVPSASLAVLTGANPFVSAGSGNTGRITGTPGSTVYVMLEFTAGASDFVSGQIGTTNFVNLSSTATMIYPVVVPPAGFFDYNLYFLDNSTTASAQVSVTNSIGTDTATYKYWYKQIFRGQVDLSTISHDGPKVTCQALESGMAKYLKSNEATTIEIPMDVPEVKWVKLDGIVLHETTNFQPIFEFDLSAADNAVYNAPVTFMNNEGDHTGVELQSQINDTVNSTPDNWMLKDVAQPAVDVTLEGRLSLTCTEKTATNATTRFFLFKGSDDPSFGTAYEIPGPGASHVTWNEGETTVLDFTGIVIPLAIGENIQLRYANNGFVGTSCTFQFNQDSFIKAKYNSRYQSTFTRAFTGQYLMNKFIPFITDSTYSAALSSYLEANKQLLFTSGNAIRGLNDATLKTNFSDFFQFWDSYDAVGIYEKQNKIYIDRKKNMVDESNVITLPSPKVGTFKVTFAKEFSFNEFEVGYPEIKNEIGALNGNQEFNDTMLFSLGTTINPARLSKVAKYKTSCYEIEKLRVTTINKDTTDYKSDNDVFVLAVEATEQTPAVVLPTPTIIAPYFLLDRSLNTSATGLIEPATVFNLPLTPKRNLKRNGDYLRSALYLSDGRTLQFMSADKNSSVVAAGLAENGPENIGGLGDQFFLPVNIDAEFDSEENILDLLDANPLQVFEFPMPDFTVRGIMQTSGVSPSNRKSQQYQFLSSPFNDLNKMKTYNG